MVLVRYLLDTMRGDILLINIALIAKVEVGLLLVKPTIIIHHFEEDIAHILKAVIVQDLRQSQVEKSGKNLIVENVDTTKNITNN